MNLITSKESARIIAMHKKGKSQRAIADTIGRSRAGVWGVLSREGLIKPKKTKRIKVTVKPAKKPRSKSEALRLAVQRGKKR